MKRAVMFLLSFLLLGAVAISGTYNNAFAWHGSPPSEEVVIVICSVSGSAFNVTAVSNPLSSTVPISPGNDCATDLTALKNAGLVIRNVQPLNTSPPSVVYTFVNGSEK